MYQVLHYSTNDGKWDMRYQIPEKYGKFSARLLTTNLITNPWGVYQNVPELDYEES